MNLRALVLLLVLAPAPLAAAGFGLFQHGGRGAGQVGAFVARADDPSAVRYNPAGLARLEGFQFEAGLDFGAPKDEFDSQGRTDLAHHIIDFPAALYATWKPKKLRAPLTFGLGLDSPYWTIEDWDTGLFPGRFDTRRQETNLFELRPTVAWAIDERWSLGGSLRYVKGAFDTSFATTEVFLGAPQLSVVAEIDSAAATRVDGFGVDIGVQYTAPNWGLGAVVGSGVALDGSGEMTYSPHDLFADSAAEADFHRRFSSSAVAMNFKLPPTLSAGLWWGLSEALKLEADVVWSGWSALDRTRIVLAEDPYASPPPALDRRRDWKDVVSLRVGAEWTFSPQWALGGGIALEPSPVPEATLEPGFSQGDAVVIALGASYNLPGLSFDLGYSRYQYSDRKAALGGLDFPVRGTFSGRAQVFSASARWRR